MNIQENRVPFNKPYTTGKELEYIARVCETAKLAGDGEYSKKCHEWLETNIGCLKAMLTPSCTAALEMAAILCDIQSGDEIIMPSYAFPSIANAFVLRGGTPVFVDIRADTLNIDENQIEAAITPKTKAICVIHYAGVGCEMDVIMDIAQRHNVFVIEDTAQGMLAKYKGRSLGSFGHLAALSFHETKNIQCGEGGALLINEQRFIEQAEIIREKGTNRKQFFRGEIDKYRWVEKGSSFLPSEITAAFLWAQLNGAEEITQKRLQIWRNYHQALGQLEAGGLLKCQNIPAYCDHNAHIYYLLLNNLQQRTEFIAYMKKQQINPAFHYVPLHSSPAGKLFGRGVSLPNTNHLANSLVRLPMWIGVEKYQPRIIDLILDFFTKNL